MGSYVLEGKSCLLLVQLRLVLPYVLETYNHVQIRSLHSSRSLDLFRAATTSKDLFQHLGSTGSYKMGAYKPKLQPT